MINFVFCDDNVQYLSYIQDLVKGQCAEILTDGEYQVGSSFCSGKDLMEYLKDNQADVLFLDIDMPHINGFDVAKIVCKQYKDIKIIFMSAYDNFVYNAFEFYPFAYLRKSHMQEELPKVLHRVIDKIREPSRRLLLSTVDGAKMVKVSAITHVESDRNYYVVHTTNNRKYICRGTLTQFEKEVEKYDYFRIHAAFLVNLEHVDKMLDDGYVLVGNTSLPIAQRRMQDFKKAYMDYIRRCFGT
ncbi:MAG: LytTR family transcriptional regulator DNA-binding domain-containing protein [Clostridia bacterium]|nr:LytTR family transcriptional regulator DNA-binding domain-containing protein [Clostridia bacterium]